MNKIYDIANIIAEKANPEYIPEYVKPVCVLSGSYYDMGLQFATQLQDGLYNTMLHLISRILKGRGPSGVIEDAREYEKIIAHQSPEIIDMFHGTADGLAVPYEAVLIYAIPNLLLPIPQNACSTISVWGKATKDGNLYCAANADGGVFTPTSYGPTMILYPENGNICVCNGGFNSNLALNEKGLVTMASNGGWNGGQGDVGYGTGAILSVLQLSLKTGSADEAMHHFTKVNKPVGSAENFHCADVSGTAYLIESTFAHSCTRTSGEFKEDDYLLATNYFLSEEMQTSRPKADNNINSIYRYRSEEQRIRELYGTLDANELDKVLSCADYFDGEKWVRNVWDEELGRWSPEKRSPKNSTYMQCFADPVEKTVYLRQGEKCTTCSNVAYSTGGKSRITLKEHPEKLVEESLDEAKRRLYHLSGKLETGQAEKEPGILQRIELAKVQVWKGDNYKALGFLRTESFHDELLYLSKALTAFSKAQALLDI